MATPLANIHKCTLGGDAFQLEDFEFDSRPTVRDGRRTGSDVSLSGKGWIEAADPSALAVAIAAAAASCQVSGQDFEVFGPGGVSLLKLPAATCLNGGPHVAFKVEAGLSSSTGARGFSFELSAETVDGGGTGGGDTPAATYALKLETSADGLRVITWTGDITSTPGAAYTDFTKLLESFGKAYALPRFVVTHVFETNVAGDRGRFTVRAAEGAEDLPAASDEDRAVDGSYTMRTDRDEQMRLTPVWDYDLAYVGDVDRVVSIIRPKDVPILRQTVNVTHFPHPRVQVTFVTLSGGNGNALMNWTATFSYTRSSPNVYDQHTYPGLLPVLVARERTVGRLVFSGSAVGAGVYIPPPPIPDLALLENPQEGRTEINEIERRTDWTYVLALGPVDVVVFEQLLKLLTRPTKGIPPIPRGLYGAAPGDE